MRGELITKPCELCGTLITRSLTQHGSRKHWTCNQSCSFKLRLREGTGPRAKDPTYTGAKETRPCAVCGTPVTRLLSQRPSTAVWTCSNVCNGTLRGRALAASGNLPKKPRRGKSHPCEVCGKPVYRQPSAADGIGRYCSGPCRIAASVKAPIRKPCEWCGRELVLRPSEGIYKYCSRECMLDARAQASKERAQSERPPKIDRQGYIQVWVKAPTPEHLERAIWKAQHRVVVEELLGHPIPKGSHVHHKDGNKQNNAPDNLVVLTQHEHAALTQREYNNAIARDRAELAAYRARFGPLP